MPVAQKRDVTVTLQAVKKMSLPDKKGTYFIQHII